ncbi:MAG: N-acetyl-gamma-glutamyl-phosphate reductase, partial [Thermoanaerobaculales bacterium]|nr:N-acetyl-gamma-glutamyl-phosphate reductase [Thermoanaerobaculales bacterium]
LIGILKRHPGATPVLVEHRAQTADEAPIFDDGIERRPLTPEGVAGLDVVFLATSPEVSIESAPMILKAGVRVIDLSGAFRLRTKANYLHWYGAEHGEEELLAEATYGLPEFYRDKIPGKKLISNPGCYPTAANLAIRPLVAEGIFDKAAGIVCDGKSGVSGAGKKPSQKTHFCEATENFSAYSVQGHRHVPEVLMNSGLDEGEFSFTAQLLPLHRGILETIYLRTQAPMSHADLSVVYAKHYGAEPFVRIYPEGRFPDLRAVQHTNFCDIGFKTDPKTKRVTVVAAIDNLVKGASGQAVQNMNLVFGQDETAGLL